MSDERALLTELQDGCARFEEKYGTPPTQLRAIKRMAYEMRVAALAGLQRRFRPDETPEQANMPLQPVLTFCGIPVAIDDSLPYPYYKFTADMLSGGEPTA